jgi:hypothetical protein
MERALIFDELPLVTITVRGGRVVVDWTDFHTDLPKQEDITKTALGQILLRAEATAKL